MIREYVREKKILTLMDALKKMTVLTADRVNLDEKGEIKEGRVPTSLSSTKTL